jgi:hypothetical protein
MSSISNPLPVHRRVSAEDFHGAAYQSTVLALSQGPYLDFPAVLSIETLSLCNAACDFCPYPGLQRKNEAMSDALIEKILSDVAEIQDRPPFEVTLSRVNEPFLDTRVMDITEEIQRRFPEATHMFFSNGTPLVEKTLLRLSRIRKVSFLSISVNDHRADHYERVMRLPFEKTLDRLELIHAMKSSGALPFNVYLTRVGDGSEADGEFFEWVKGKYPGLSGLVTVRGDWMGAVPGKLVGLVPSAGCRQWFQLHFLSNGKTAFCCIDSDGRHGTGDVSTQHAIREIYNDPEKRALRLEVPSRLGVRECRTCPMLP